jgi:hypothetical protein
MAAAPGNQYARKAKDWENALRRALERYENPEKKVQSGMALAKIAEKVVERAIEGDQKAVEEIANRLDGKPTQTIAGDEDAPLTIKGMVELVRPG